MTQQLRGVYHDFRYLFFVRDSLLALHGGILEYSNNGLGIRHSLQVLVFSSLMVYFIYPIACVDSGGCLGSNLSGRRIHSSIVTNLQQVMRYMRR